MRCSNIYIHANNSDYEGTVNVDGGITKWGQHTFALFNTGNDFNGPLTIMQGAFRLGATNLPASWICRYYETTRELMLIPLNGTVMVVR